MRNTGEKYTMISETECCLICYNCENIAYKQSLSFLRKKTGKNQRGYRFPTVEVQSLHMLSRILPPQRGLRVISNYPALLSFFLQTIIGCKGSTTGLKEQKHNIGLRGRYDPCLQICHFSYPAAAQMYYGIFFVMLRFISSG